MLKKLFFILRKVLKKTLHKLRNKLLVFQHHDNNEKVNSVGNTSIRRKEKKQRFISPPQLKG